MTMEGIMQVEATFLGPPRLRLEKAEKSLGKNKLDALLYYLLYHEEMDREEVASVFWPGQDSNRAKGSLRNSLYEIRRILDVDLFSASTRERIVLGRDITLFRDIDALLESGDPRAFCDAPSHVFLQGCELKNNPTYESWLLTIRAAYQDIFLNSLRSLLQELPPGSSEIAPMARRILAMDSYDEGTLRILLRDCADRFQYNEALAIFRRAKETLDAELGVPPEAETLQLVHTIAIRRQSLQERPAQGFQSAGLLTQLQESLEEFFSGRRPRHVLVYGDPGSGRTRLIETFLNTQDQRSCKLRLDYPNKEIPEGFLLKWSRLFQGRPQEDFRSLLLHLPEEPLILVLENLEFMDHKSLLYLTDFLTAAQNRVFCILEATRELIGRSDAIAFLVQNADLAQIEVPLLDREQLVRYLAEGQAEQAVTEEEVDAVFEFSRGNLLLVDEYRKPQGQLERLFIQLTVGLVEEEKAILEAASVYPRGFTAQMARIHARDAGSLMKHLRSLVQRGLLVESGDLLMVRYPPLRQWIYDKLPRFYRVHLHELAADNTLGLNYSLRQVAQHRAWHWMMAGQTAKGLTYELAELELALNFFDQMFPSRVDPTDLPDQLYQTKQELHARLDDLCVRIQRESPRLGQAALPLEMGAAWLQGRRFIAGGRREEGIRLIGDVRRKAAIIGDQEFLLRACIETIHYAIHNEDQEQLGREIRLAGDLLESPDIIADLPRRAEVLRLAGLHAIGQGQWQQAEALLEEAAAIWWDPRLSATGFLAHAGTLNYLGRAREAMGDFAGADEAFRQSIDLVRGTAHKCLDTLYADYGRFLWETGRRQAAEEILELALVEYRVLGNHWKRPSTEAILGLIAAGRGDLRSARAHLVNAQIYHKADNRQVEEGLIAELAGTVHDLQRGITDGINRKS